MHCKHRIHNIHNIPHNQYMPYILIAHTIPNMADVLLIPCTQKAPVILHEQQMLCISFPLFGTCQSVSLCFCNDKETFSIQKTAITRIQV